MGEVTIDSIQIEIESNSTNGPKGLDALAKTLRKLKKNGLFKTFSTSLNDFGRKNFRMYVGNQGADRGCLFQ